ncbi:MAG: DUF4159 domain-containing protein [Candidatus Latescibacteria bacterium]|nr:DUF4159 domain-containing protein [Candidatus Latescibacterota bacterium]
MARNPLNILIDTRRWQATGTVISLLVHSLFFLWALIYVGKAAERMVTHIRFVSPPPITKKSFELAKRPEISEIQMQMLLSMPQEEMPAVDASAVVDVSTFGADILSAVSPMAGVGGGGGKITGMIVGSISGARPVQMGFQPVGTIQLTQVAKPVQQAMSLRTELLNIRNLDTGRYKATIIMDPKDKRNIKGYFKMTVVRYNYMDFNQDRFPTAIDELMRYMRDHTKINAQIEGTMIELSDAKLFDAPFIYMTGSQAIISLSPVEIENLGNYLRSGGFLFAEDIAHSPADKPGETPVGGQLGTPFDRQFKDTIKKALGSDAKWFKLPKSYDLFYSFYDFPSGPPIAAQNNNVFDLEGIELRGRLAVVFSDLNVSWYWSKESESAGRERGLQFGVNLIVYALTQPGGLANVSQFTE